MENKISKGSGAMKVVTRSAKLATLAAAAYFFFGPDGSKHREQTKSWAEKMKADVIKKIKMGHEISEFAYHKIIDSVAAKHAAGKKAEPLEIKALAQDLKKHWKKISNSAQTIKKDIIKAAAPKTIRKITSKKTSRIK